MFTFVLFALVASATAHKFSWGLCEKLPTMEGLDMEKIEGKWFVMKKMKTKMASCITNYMSALPETGMYNYTEVHQMWNQIFTKQAMLFTEDGELKVDYPTLIPDASFDVLDTDYDTFAIIYKCQPLPFSHRWSASILARDVNMNVSTINEHLKTLGEYVSTNDMNDIDHSDCVTKDEAVVTLDFGPGISVKPGGQGIKSVVDGFRGISGALKMKEDGASEEDDSINEVEQYDIEFF